MKNAKRYHDERQLYKDYQWVWDLVSSTEEYKELSDYVIQQIDKNQNYATKSLLHLGCGSGCMDFHLKRKYNVTGVDLSKRMIASAKAKNPDCEYFIGDMRNCQLNRKFDAIIIPDSIDYMMTIEDISKVYRNAKHHLNDNGLFLAIVGYEPDKFPQNRTTVDDAIENGRLVTFIENNFVPDYSRNYFEATFVFLIREKDQLETIIDVQTLGLFNRDIWFKELENAGFKAQLIDDPYLVKIEQEGTYILIGKKN